MLYDGLNPIIKIKAVEHMTWGVGSFNVAPRGHSALAFRIKGSAVIGCADGEYTVNPTDVLYLPQGVRYTAEYTETDMIVIHFLTAENDQTAEVYSINNTEEVYKLFLKARALWKSKEPGYAMYITSILYRILGIISEKEVKKALPAHFLKAMTIINSDFRNNQLSIDEVCKKAGISATVFRQLFRQQLGKTPVEYITELRLEWARNMIAGGQTVEKAAYESGFNDPKYFARVVKKKLGCTPREFREYGK